ncbi:MAG: VanW family protein [Clostridia bacterium]|nr:VanW family protein [Clostridia bacterium]
MKRFLALTLLLALFSAAAPGRTETAPEALYTVRTRVASIVYEQWDGTEGINQIGTIPKKRRVSVLALNPTFALVSFDEDKLQGYVRRVCLEDPRTVNSAVTPPYGVDFNHFLAVVEADDAPVTTAPGGGETLITLHSGARVSFISFENGYGKLIYHRQYGYIDSRLLGEMLTVYEDPETAGTDAPIAAYTSFYKITTDESNMNRMANIATACQKLCAFSLLPTANLNFNRDMGPYRASSGYKPAGVLVDGELQQGYGGGTCQVSSTLYNVVLQLPGLTVLQRRAHGENGASYLPIEMDAAVGNSSLNFRFRNDYSFPLRIDASSQDGALTIAFYRAE